MTYHELRRTMHDTLDELISLDHVTLKAKLATLAEDERKDLSALVGSHVEDLEDLQLALDDPEEWAARYDEDD